MKALSYLAFAFLVLASASGLRAQWISKTYPLVDGWNSVWLAGDASYATVSELLDAYPNIAEVWRWNPNPDQVTFTTSPSQPTTQSDEWTIWKRDDANEQLLSRMVGNSAYLMRSVGSSSLVIKQRPLPPAANWQISGANFLGFPALSATPTFASYFASFPSANTSVLSPASKIYKYIGGPLNAVNPQQISPSSEKINPGTAYWFQTATVSDFTAPLEYELASDAGLAFGRTLNSMTIGVTNRSTSSLTVTISLQDSEAAPTGQPGVTSGVALTRRVFDPASNAYTETPILGSFNVTIPASGRANLEFGIDRSALTDSEAFSASILRLRDTAKLTDVSIPVSAQAATTAGLWVAKTTVTDVVSATPSPSGSAVARPFELIFLIHVDSDGTARLLSQAFTGRLVTGGNPLGISIYEEQVFPTGASDVPAARYVAAQMPMVPFIMGSGAVANGSSIAWQISIPFDDPTNPFVHAYHPDHDNLDASFSLRLQDGVESYSITRDCRFTFTNEPPSGGAVSGWGSTVLGGTYQETLFGLNAKPLQTSGTFAMRRISEIANIETNLPEN